MRVVGVIPYDHTPFLAALRGEEVLIGYLDGGPRDRTADSPFVDDRPGDVGCVHDLRVYRPAVIEPNTMAFRRWLASHAEDSKPESESERFPEDPRYDAWLRMRQLGEEQPTTITIASPYGISDTDQHMRIAMHHTYCRLGSRHARPFDFGARGEPEE